MCRPICATVEVWQLLLKHMSTPTGRVRGVCADRLHRAVEDGPALHVGISCPVAVVVPDGPFAVDTQGLPLQPKPLQFGSIGTVSQTCVCSCRDQMRPVTVSLLRSPAAKNTPGGAPRTLPKTPRPELEPTVRRWQHPKRCSGVLVRDPETEDQATA